MLVYVLHRVLYPQVHVNGIKKKKTMSLSASHILVFIRRCLTKLA